MVAHPCAIEGCGGTAGIPGANRDWCTKHYQRWRRNGDPLALSLPLPEVCSIESCGKPRKGRGWCGAHWLRWRQFGDPLHRKLGEIRDGKRVCPQCGVDKPLAEYGKHSGKKDGLQAYCRPCERDKTARWRAANPDYISPPAPPEVRREAMRRWRRENPDKVRAACAVRRARRIGATVESVSPAEIFERDGWMCRLCDDPIDQLLTYPDQMSASVDHRIPLSRGGAHSKANCQAAHLICNLRKNNKLEVRCG